MMKLGQGIPGFMWLTVVVAYPARTQALMREGHPQHVGIRFWGQSEMGEGALGGSDDSLCCQRTLA